MINASVAVVVEIVFNNNSIKRDFQRFWTKFVLESTTAGNQPIFKGYNFANYGFGKCDVEPTMISPTDDRIESYESALRRAILKISSEDLNMLFVVLPDNFGDEQYYRLKAIAFNETQVSQFFRTSTLSKKYPLVYWNLAVSLYAKMDGIPWALALEPDFEKEPIDVDLFIGICFVQRDQKSFVGVATILDRLSEHIVTINSPPISYSGRQLHMTEEDIHNLVTKCLNEVQFGVDSAVVQYATPFNKSELKGVNTALKDVTKKAFVHIETETLSRLYSLEDPNKNVRRGTALIIDNDKAVLCTTGKCGILGTSMELEDEDEEWRGGLTTSLKYRGLGTPKPIGVNKVGDFDIETICRQILALTKLRWNTSEVNIRIPATIEYARKIGYLCKFGIPNTVRGIKYVL